MTIEQKINNNSIQNSSILNNVINLIQNILEENRKNKNKISDINDSMNKQNNLSEDYKENNISLDKNNNNFYSNVHIKAITNIKELISNNNNTIKDYHHKNNKSLTVQNYNILENNNNESKYNSFLRNSAQKRKNSKIKKLKDNSKTLNKVTNQNKSYYSLKRTKYDITNFLTNRKLQNENNLKKIINESNNEDKKRSTSKKDGNSTRMSLKSYIKKVKNMYILKKLSNNKKLEIKNNNSKININNLSFGEDDIKPNNKTKEEINNLNYLNNINKINLKEQEGKEDINSNNSRISNNFKENKSNYDSLNKDINIKANDANNISPKKRKKSINSKSIKRRSLRIKKNYNFSYINTSNKNKNQSMDKKRNRRISVRNVDNLSKRERSYYILSKSPMLRLTERFLFGRATPNLRNVQSIESILNRNELILKDKVKELEEKLVECDKKIKLPFTASKTAEIAFNFILKKDEDEFRNYILLTQNEEEKKEYYTYIKIIYLLFEESYENIELKYLNDKLYELIGKKGFKSIKDYLYYIFITKKEKVNIPYKIDKINNLLAQSPELINKQFNGKLCRFVLFTSFLVNEIIQYGNDIINAIELEIKTKEFIEVVNKKLELYQKFSK